MIGRVYLASVNREESRTKHFDGGVRLPRPSYLLLVENTDGFLLLHVNSEDYEMTDTLHDSVIEAIEQAQFEFDIPMAQWEQLQPAYFQDNPDTLSDEKFT